MPKTYAYQIDDETAILIDQDREAMSGHAGVELSSSAYHRLVMLRHLQGAGGNPVKVGFLEGFRAGFAQVNKALQTAMHDVVVDMERRLAAGEDLTSE